MPTDAIRPARIRWHHALATVVVIGLGLASRRFTWLFPAELGKYPGDALWALMVFMAMCVAWPRASRPRPPTPGVSAGSGSTRRARGRFSELR